MPRSAQPRYLNGKALRRKRLAAGLEQAQLAEKCGVTQSHVSNWETEYNGCRLGMLHKLAEALGCPAADLMRDDANPAAGKPEDETGDADQEPERAQRPAA